jgi:transposase
MTLPAEIEDLIASLKAQILALQAENSELRRRLGLDSSNSSKPPSSDGLKKKPRILGSLRGRSDKQSGGQKGHQGGTLRQVANPDAAVRHEACACGHCGAALDATSATGIEKRQVFDIPERPLLVTEHQATIYHCMRCRGVTKATFPEGVVSPTQYGERIKAAAIYLNVQQLIPEDRAAQALSDLFGAPLICPASIVAWVGKKARELCQVYEAIGQRVAEAGVRHLDETGYRIAGKLHWLHTTSSLSFTFYRAGEKRGDIPKDLQGGVVVHDHFLPYRGMDAVDHAFCNAHILRELQALIEFEKEPWAELMRTMLLDANAAVDKAREAGACALPPDCRGLHRTLLGRCAARSRLPSTITKTGTEITLARTLQTTSGPQSARTAQDVQNRDLAVHDRLRRAFHQQLGRAGPANDEGQNENLGVLPNPRRGADFRHPQIRRFYRPKTGLQYPPRPHRSQRSGHASHRRIASGLGVTAKEAN